jgi:hypothetical protein
MSSCCYASVIDDDSKGCERETSVCCVYLAGGASRKNKKWLKPVWGSLIVSKIVYVSCSLGTPTHCAMGMSDEACVTRRGESTLKVMMALTTKAFHFHWICKQRHNRRQNFELEAIELTTAAV